MGRLGKTEKGIRRYTRGGKEISFQKVVELMDYTEEEEGKKKGRHDQGREVTEFASRMI